MVDRILQHVRTLESQNGSAWAMGKTYQGWLYLNNVSNGFTAYQLSTGKEWSPGYVNTTGAVNNGGMCIVGGASAVWNSVNNTELNFMELSSGYFHRVTTGIDSASQIKDQQVSPSGGGYIVFSGNNNGEIQIFNTATWTNAKFTGIAAAPFNCFIPKSNGNVIIAQHGIAGASGGPQIREYNCTAGATTLVKQFGVPNWTRSFPAAFSINATGLNSIQYIVDPLVSTTERLVLGDYGGAVTLVDYGASGAILDRVQLTGDGASNSGGGTGTILSSYIGTASSINGYMFASCSDPNNTSQHLSVLRVTSSSLTVLETYAIPKIDACVNLEVDTLTGTLTMVQNNQFAKVFKITVPAISTVTTRTQDPPGNDVAARYIRLKDIPGHAYVDSDQNAASGARNLNVNSPGEYYEISLTGSGGSLKWDWRKFNL